jgi:hypothetical protein
MADLAKLMRIERVFVLGFIPSSGQKGSFAGDEDLIGSLGHANIGTLPQEIDQR